MIKEINLKESIKLENGETIEVSCEWVEGTNKIQLWIREGQSNSILVDVNSRDLEQIALLVRRVGIAAADQVDANLPEKEIE